jgi:hypothetical protein
MRMPRVVALMLILAYVASPASRAAIIDGNLRAGGAYDTMTGHPFGSSKPYTDLAIPFTFQGNDFMLEKVVVAVAKFANTTENRFAVHVCADAGGVPGIILETVVVRATVNWPGSLVSAVFSGTNKLDRGTPYWVRLDKSHSPPFFIGGPFAWMYNSAGDARSMMQSTDGGTGWAAILGGPPAAAFQVEGTVVPPPEPPALECCFQTAGGVPNKLVWQTGEDWIYDLFHSTDLSGWTRVAGFPQTGGGAPMEHTFTAGMCGFFRIVLSSPGP